MSAPLFISNKCSFTKRDSLGLQSLSSSLQAQACPIINVVTWHPFYWAFLIWNYYYYYYQNPNIKERSDSDFNENCVKVNDFFFIVANYLNGTTDGVVGRTKIEDMFQNKDEHECFAFDKSYYSSRFGGMQYYNFGCFEMNYVRKEGNTNKVNIEASKIKFKEEFDSAISNTAVYKNYISKNIPLNNLTKEELIELSEYLNFSMDKLGGIKEMIYESLFKRDKLKQIEKYINLLLKYNLLSRDDFYKEKELRQALYGDKQPAILDKQFADTISKETIVSWELIIANQFYVTCVELIWKYVLSILTVPVSKDEWVNLTFEKSIEIELDRELLSVEKELTVEETIDRISNGSNNRTLSNVLAVLMSIYHRFKDREKDFTCLDTRRNSEYYVFDLVKRIKSGELKTERDLFCHLIEHRIIERHEYVAMKKRYAGRDGYFFEKVDNQYKSIGRDDFTVSRPPLRISNVFCVLSDLGKI